MTIKCALAGLSAGGGKCVVLDHPGLDRCAAFAALGEQVQALGGRFRTAGDLGTTTADLKAAKSRSEFVHVDDDHLQLAAAVGKTVLAGIGAALDIEDTASLDGVKVGVQGAGVIGEAVARTLARAGARLWVNDLDNDRARQVADSVGAEVASSVACAHWNVDVLAPCAMGGALGVAHLKALKAKAVVGGANGILRPSELGPIAEVLKERSIVFVPDVLSSSGAVIAGIARTVMHVDPEPLLAAVKDTTERVLMQSGEDDMPTWEAASRMAAEILAAVPLR